MGTLALCPVPPLPPEQAGQPDKPGTFKSNIEGRGAPVRQDGPASHCDVPYGSQVPVWKVQLVPETKTEGIKKKHATKRGRIKPRARQVRSTPDRNGPQTNGHIESKLTQAFHFLERMGSPLTLSVRGSDNMRLRRK